jgi:hypothetical protein
MSEPSEDEENQTYASFIKAFSPVLLHLASDNTQIKDIIKEFQELSEDAIPDRANTRILRTWVDSKQDEIDEMTPEEITNIMQSSRLTRVDENAFHTNSYSLGKKRTRESCMITMESIKPNEYFVDFLDGGKPYKVAAIIEYYKRMKASTPDREDWKTPLRNPITKEQEESMEDLIRWYENTKRCFRKRKTLSNSRINTKSKSKSKSKSPDKKRGTIRRRKGKSKSSKF